MAQPLTEEEIEQESLKRVVDYASFFQNSVEGPRILRYLKDALDGPTYKPGMDPLVSAYLAGRRSVYLGIIDAVGDGLAEMSREVRVEPTQQEAMMSVAIEDL